MPDRDLPELLAEVFRVEWARLVAASMRLVGDLQAAEDVVQDVLMAALDRWPLTEVPANPAAWLMTACRNRALNLVRDASRARDRTRALAPLLSADTAEEVADPPSIEDDRLRLVFICCHPVLPVDNQVALTLRLVGGLSTEEIARAWHVPTATIAQRIVRAKRVLAQRKVPFAEPTGTELAERLPAVLDVVYLVFNEGYLAGSGHQLTRLPLVVEAHRLSRLLTELMPAHPETWALRSLIALHRSRESTRLDPAGQLLTLEQQDRSQWDQTQIIEGIEALARARALVADEADLPLVLQAQMAVHHATAASFDATDWAGIVACYDKLLARAANPVVALNRAVAVAMADGPEVALPLLAALVERPALSGAHRVWAVRADLYRRLGQHDQALPDYDRALALVDNDVERRHLEDMRNACMAAEALIQ